MKLPSAASALLFAFVLGVQAGEPIRLHPDNPHYFLWQGKPAVLITAGEHYGAVINLDFDYRRYLDELKDCRFNLTRLFSGTYRERPDSFNITGNTLAPAQGRYVCPWARSDRPGAWDGGNKFDLTKWDTAYFTRLSDFMAQARQRGVIVEFVLFGTMYDDSIWKASPMNVGNNVNGIGDVGAHEVYSANDTNLLAVQKAVVQKLVTELNAFDNVYFEVCNEPYERSGLTRAWNDQIIAAIVNTEIRLPKTHLIAQGFPPSPTAVADLNPNISVLNFHGAKPDAIRLNDTLHKVIACDETGGADRTNRKYRTEGWEFILAGGGVYDHLDFSFTPTHEDGTAVPLPSGTPGGGGPELRRQLRILQEFIEGFDFLRMMPDAATIKRSVITTVRADGARVPAQATIRALAKAGQAYAIYITGGTDAELVLELGAGTYQAKWWNTKTGTVEKTEEFEHVQGERTLVSPTYSEDIALSLRR
jgi:hypothetical protein